MAVYMGNQVLVTNSVSILKIFCISEVSKSKFLIYRSTIVRSTVCFTDKTRHRSGNQFLCSMKVQSLENLCRISPKIKLTKFFYFALTVFRNRKLKFTSSILKCVSKQSMEANKDYIITLIFLIVFFFSFYFYNMACPFGMLFLEFIYGRSLKQEYKRVMTTKLFVGFIPYKVQANFIRKLISFDNDIR